MLSVGEDRLLNLDDAFRNSIFRVRTSFGEVPGLLRMGEFLYRF